MSLIHCPECKKQISNTAKECPNCGYQLEKERKKENDKRMMFLYVIIFIVFFIALKILKIV
ncbi:MAG: DUF2116 family Zn-ribbon domain-containing protein [Capnocytophaga ochracea]|jgi:hypothetical protein|uniref:Zinc-ribbon containing domain protein n=1 Tax=Siphoviridae sp. ctnFV5 TaxID=2823600 RepID=A0A8S5L7G0_9CAUD|nr:MAG TPA: zinc-ribbon containing domain protein [Siphoviridae sp. ctnFV5]